MLKRISAAMIAAAMAACGGGGGSAPVHTATVAMGGDGDFPIVGSPEFNPCTATVAMGGDGDFPIVASPEYNPAGSNCPRPVSAPPAPAPAPATPAPTPSSSYHKSPMVNIRPPGRAPSLPPDTSSFQWPACDSAGRCNSF